MWQNLSRKYLIVWIPKRAERDMIASIASVSMGSFWKWWSSVPCASIAAWPTSAPQGSDKTHRWLLWDVLPLLDSCSTKTLYILQRTQLLLFLTFPLVIPWCVANWTSLGHAETLTTAATAFTAECTAPCDTRTWARDTRTWARDTCMTLWGTMWHRLCRTMDQGLCCSMTVPILMVPELCRMNSTSETPHLALASHFPTRHQLNMSWTSWNAVYSNNRRLYRIL